MPETSKRIFEILEANETKDFVNRILNPEKADAIVNPDGSYSTHRMAVEVGKALGEKNNKWYVFPTIIKDDDGFLVEHEDWKTAWPTAKKKKDYIKFDSFEEADWFERNWKTIWGMPPRKD